jgi:hypothetical protein
VDFFLGIVCGRSFEKKYGDEKKGRRKRSKCICGKREELSSGIRWKR